MIVARCRRCGGEMAPFPVGSGTTVWFCLRCECFHVEVPDLWRWAAERGRR